MRQSSSGPAGSGISTGRVETLADGVFAIVMTLLILDIRAPDVVRDSADLQGKLIALLPHIRGYALSFLILGVLWVGHHNQFYYIKRTDRIFLWINIAFLMCVAFIPFSSALLVNG